MKEKIDFLKSSINDIQGTIRLIDAKIIALLFIILMPITQIKLIFASIELVYSYNFFIGLAVSLIMIVTWISSLTFSLLTIIGVRNPKENIPNNTNYKGLYFGDNLFKLSYKNLVANNKAKIETSVEDYLKKFEGNDDTILFNELVYEQVKLSFIRDVKMLRQKIAFISLYITTIVTISIILVGLILANHG